MSQVSSINLTQKDFPEEIPSSTDNTPPKKARKYSTNSSNSDSFFTNINAEIKNFIENEDNLSFSSNSEQESPCEKNNIDYLLEPRFWRVNKNTNYDMEYNNVKKIFGTNEKNGKNGEESNKQSTQGNEDEETRFEPLHNTISTESNNSPLITLTNNESCENEINCDKITSKEEKVGNNEINYNNNKEKSINKEEKGKIDINKNNNKDNINLMTSNLLINGSNFTNNINFKNINSDSKFIFPYEPVNFMTNQTGANFMPNSYLAQNLRNFTSGYNLPSPIGNRNIISINNNNSNKLNKIINEKNSENSEQNGANNNNINGQNNKYVNQTNNNYSKPLNPNQKDISELPLILNQNNIRNMPMNYNIPKLNLNMTYYPKIQNCTLPIQKQSLDKMNNTNNSLPELKSLSNNNIQDKKAKNNNNTNISTEASNSSSNNNNINNYNYTNNKMKSNFNKNIINNFSNVNNKGQKGEKQFLNLDDIANGKDLRTTIMIRNIPIKYTDEILNEEFEDFHGKYDCLYMPYDYEKNGNKGYAFINFVNPLHILLFYEKFNGKKWIHFESSKICELNMAHFQGFNEIQKHAKNFKELKKTNYNKNNENMVIPSKYLSKLKKRFPKMKYNENKNKKEFIVKSFE